MQTASPKPDHLRELSELQARLVQRAGLFAHIRRFFDTRGFIHVETPVRIAAPAPEEFIEAPRSGNRFLRCSPELEMKRLVCAGYDKIYQIGPCFRQDEHGSRHREEFTMLEWYQTDADYLDLMDFTADMVRSVIALPVEKITVNEAYLKYAGVTAAEAMAQDAFDELMVEKIEPGLGRGRMTFLMDYPASRASLARLKKDDPSVAERWELYIDGLELANAYSELTDAPTQRVRFAAERAARAASALADYPEPAEFLESLASGMPECAGCALGLDRLAMIYTKAADIAHVTFPV